VLGQHSCQWGGGECRDAAHSCETAEGSSKLGKSEEGDEERRGSRDPGTGDEAKEAAKAGQEEEAGGRHCIDQGDGGGDSDGHPGEVEGLHPGLVTQPAGAEAADHTADAEGGDEEGCEGGRDPGGVGEVRDAGVGDVKGHDRKAITKGIEKEDWNLFLNRDAASQHSRFPHSNICDIGSTFNSHLSVLLVGRRGHEQASRSTAKAKSRHDSESVPPSQNFKEGADKGTKEHLTSSRTAQRKPDGEGPPLGEDSRHGDHPRDVHEAEADAGEDALTPDEAKESSRPGGDEPS